MSEIERMKAEIDIGFFVSIRMGAWCFSFSAQLPQCRNEVGWVIVSDKTKVGSCGVVIETKEELLIVKVK